MNIKKLKKAAQSYGTPLYVYDLSVIDRQLEKLKVAFNKINNYQIHFAAKALSNISILKYINSLGLGLDAVSIEEVKIGIKCGFKKEEILSILFSDSCPKVGTPFSIPMTNPSNRTSIFLPIS